MSLREVLVKIATGVVKSHEKKLPPGYHMAVVVTDENGDYVGVHATADTEYTMRILQAACTGAALKFHRRGR